eukprot:TRINITY_DN19468_c0_g1_i1.p1 TRINITY_DN19468_c0_g1~~TRINITY_DN19468_c0_g1_i1.p1  ORF type:complete len:1399 (-),score=264.60 TRINITY_DN19468_c0_g1_i1:93-3698(-)
MALLLADPPSIVRFVEHLDSSCQEFLNNILVEWSRLHLVRVLEQNRSPRFDAAGQDHWTWMPTGQRSHYFQSYVRRSEELALVIRSFWSICFSLDTVILSRFLTWARGRSPPLFVMDEFFPMESHLFHAVAADAGKRMVRLFAPEVRQLMRLSGFYDHSVQTFLAGNGVEDLRAVLQKGSTFARLMLVVQRLIGFCGGQMAEAPLESSLSQICTACRGHELSVDLLDRVLVAAATKPDVEFLPDGVESFSIDEPSAFTVAGLAVVARRIREACEGVRSHAAQVTFGQVVDAFLETAPRGWVALFSALDTVLFFLRLKGREDLELAYERFEAENRGAADGGEDIAVGGSGVRALLATAREFYRTPFLDLRAEAKTSGAGNSDASAGAASAAADLRNFDVRAAIERQKIRPQSASAQALPTERGSGHGRPRGGFSVDDWNSVVEIAGLTAEGMRERYSVPMLPHHTQMIALLIFAAKIASGLERSKEAKRAKKSARGAPAASSASPLQPRTLIAKVGTGEGKSWIIGMLAAFVARRGLTAHVVIDNATLLERDYATMSPLFDRLGISHGKRSLDTGSQVVYCSSADIESHWLQQVQANGRGPTFCRCALIVDEVDSLIVDEKVYKCYVDYHNEGSEVCNSWWRASRGGGNSTVGTEPVRWKRRIKERLVEAEGEARLKREGRDFVADAYCDAIWALDERSLVMRSAWFLWLELKRKQRDRDYVIRYMTRQSVVCKKSCFSSYTFIFGLTGSLGTEAEKRFTQEHFGAEFLNVPAFLDTCRGERRSRATCLATHLERNAAEQQRRTVQLAKEYCVSVPVVIVARDQQRVERLAAALRAALPSHSRTDLLGPGVVELLDSPGHEAEFQQMVEVATQPLEVTPDEGTVAVRQWRITITTAVGARGQDYHISDDLVDERGGLLLILEYVPDSEREWIQFLGRTARHDHPGQYVVVLNAEEYKKILAEGLGPTGEAGLVRRILEDVNNANEQQLTNAGKQLARGAIMHKLTSSWWALSKKIESFDNTIHRDALQSWVTLCEDFEEMSEQDISNSFDQLVKDTVASIGEDDAGSLGLGLGGDGVLLEQNAPDVGSDGSVYQGEYSQGKRHGHGQCTFLDGRIYIGQWALGKMSGDGQMTWPNGLEYIGQYDDDRRSGVGRLSWPDGRCYDGEWAKGKQQGRGTYTDAIGRSWTGDWHAGKKLTFMTAAI